MTINTYEVGDRVRISTSTPFTDINSNAIDPDVVTFEVNDPTGTTTSYIYGTDSNVTKAGTGDYDCDVDAETAGIWNYYIKGETSGNENRGAAQGKFRVLRKGT